MGQAQKAALPAFGQRESGAAAALPADPPVPKAKAGDKKNPFTCAKTISSKITAVSGKYTDAVCWETKLVESSLTLG